MIKTFFQPKTILSLALIIMAVLIINAGSAYLPFEGLSFGMDWFYFRGAINHGVLNYRDFPRNVFYPPWPLLLLTPLTFLSFEAGWSVLALTTLFALIISVPREGPRWQFIVRVIALVSCFISLRQIADGNLELFMVLGGLALVYGYEHKSVWASAAGVILISAKVQSSWLGLLMFAWMLGRAWPVKRWGQALLIVGVVVGPLLLLFGRDWVSNLTYLSSLMTGDHPYVLSISLSALDPFVTPIGRWVMWGLVVVVTVAVTLYYPRQFSRIGLGLWMSASLLMASYAGPMSLLGILALGVIAWPPAAVGWVLLVFALVDLPYLALLMGNVQLTLNWPQWPWTLILLLIWLVSLWLYYRSSPATVQPLQ